MHVIDWPSHPQLLKELYDLVRTPDGCEHASGKHDDLIGAAARAIFSAGMWLDANAVYESPPEQEEEPEPNEAAERALYHGDTRAEWHRRGRGSVLKGEPDPDLVPKPGSLAERIERSRSNDRDGVLVRF